MCAVEFTGRGLAAGGSVPSVHYVVDIEEAGQGELGSDAHPVPAGKMGGDVSGSKCGCWMRGVIAG